MHDDWQQSLGRLALGKRKNGKYAATVGGVVLSIPRQVGKTFTVGTVIFALCLLFPNLTVIWTAHHTRTSDETFGAMQGIARRLRMRPYIAGVRRANGQQAITFRNGSRILFGAREQGFGRGFAEVDIEVFDEAQILNERALEDMVAATNQAKHPAGALLFYMGTPPRPSDPGEAFAKKRAKALARTSSDMVYVELGADPAADPDDREQWAKANPSFPSRTPVESMLRLRENLPSLDAWLREGLGIWDDEGANLVIPLAKWSARGDSRSKPPAHIGGVVLAVDSDPERKRTTIVAAGERAEGPPMIEVTSDADGDADNRAGVEWAAGRVIEICGRTRVVAVVIDKASAAASLAKQLEDAHLPVRVTTSNEYAAACGQFYDAAVETGQIAHLDDPLFVAALKGATRRGLGDAWAWDRKKPSVDITPLTAATLALWGWNAGVGRPLNAGRGRVIAL